MWFRVHTIADCELIGYRETFIWSVVYGAFGRSNKWTEGERGQCVIIKHWIRKKPSHEKRITSLNHLLLFFSPHDFTLLVAFVVALWSSSLMLLFSIPILSMLTAIIGIFPVGWKHWEIFLKEPNQIIRLNAFVRGFAWLARKWCVVQSVSFADKETRNIQTEKHQYTGKWSNRKKCVKKWQESVYSVAHTCESRTIWLLCCIFVLIAPSQRNELLRFFWPISHHRLRSTVDLKWRRSCAHSAKNRLNTNTSTSTNVQMFWWLFFNVHVHKISLVYDFRLQPNLFECSQTRCTRNVWCCAVGISIVSHRLYCSFFRYFGLFRISYGFFDTVSFAL